MTKIKKRDASLKIKVAIETVKGQLTISQIASKYEIHPKQVTDWRDQLLTEGELIFTPKTSLRRTKKKLIDSSEKLVTISHQCELMGYSD